MSSSKSPEPVAHTKASHIDRNVNQDTSKTDSLYIGPNIPSFFLAGYQKTGSTWLFHCLREHPQVFLPASDAIHFFDIHYHRGVDWYRSFFEEVTNQSQIGDATPSYMRSHVSRERMTNLNPGAKYIVTLRNPIERAFSHYWHEKKKRTIRYDFETCLGNNVDIFDDWVATGFYHQHLTHLFSLVDRDQVLVLFYEDLKESPEQFFDQVLQFLAIDTKFVPSALNQQMNSAWFRPTCQERLHNIWKGHPMNESEYDRGIQPKFRKSLGDVFREENDRLGHLVGRDLSHWV